MNKSVSIAAVLVAVAAIISSSNAVAAPAKPLAPAAPASAASAARVIHHHPADATKAELKAAKGRGSLMGGCQKKAAEANLHDIERKDFLTACMAGK
jgi:hypothetical protein